MAGRYTWGGDDRDRFDCSALMSGYDEYAALTYQERRDRARRPDRREDVEALLAELCCPPASPGYGRAAWAAMLASALVAAVLLALAAWALWQAVAR